MQYLVTHVDEVQRALERATRLLTTKLAAQQEERFFITPIACLIVGAQLACKLDMFQFDIPGMIDVLVQAVRASRKTVESRTLVGHTELERLIAPVLLFGLLSLAWMIARATGVFPAFLPEASEVWLLILVWKSSFVR